MISALGGRKVVVAIVVTLIGVGAVFLKGDVPPNFLSLLQTVFGAFVAGNMFAHYTEAKKVVGAPAEEETQPQPNMEIGALEARVGDLQAQVDTVATVAGTTQQGVAWLVDITQQAMQQQNNKR